MSEKDENVFTKGARTKQQVAELAAQGKSAAEIAETLGKTVATIYSHLRNLKSEGSEGEKKEVKPRGRPRKNPETEVKSQAPKAKAANGHKAEAEFPELRGQIEKLIEQRKAELAKLESILATL